MARALKCDRCGAYYDPVYSSAAARENDECAKQIVFANVSGDGSLHYFNDTKYDVCPTCVEEFWNWIHGEGFYRVASLEECAAYAKEKNDENTRYLRRLDSNG